MTELLRLRRLRYHAGERDLLAEWLAAERDFELVSERASRNLLMAIAVLPRGRGTTRSG